MEQTVPEKFIQDMCKWIAMTIHEEKEKKGVDKHE